MPQRHVETVRPDITIVQLAGPGCPPDFHLALLRELTSRAGWSNDRWTIIITADTTSDTAQNIAPLASDPGWPDEVTDGDIQDLQNAPCAVAAAQRVWQLKWLEQR